MFLASESTDYINSSFFELFFYDESLYL